MDNKELKRKYLRENILGKGYRVKEFIEYILVLRGEFY